MRNSAASLCSRRRWLAAAAGWPLAAAASPVLGAAGERPAELRRLLGLAGLPLASIGLHVEPVAVASAAQAMRAAHNPEHRFQLASTAKLVTTLAALDLLGPRYCWRTPAFLLGPLHAGRLDGDLLILGGGDARLCTEDLMAWFRQMQSAGLREVRGNIVLDRLAFRLTDADLASTPMPGPDRPHHAWPDALMLDEGRLRLRVQGRAGATPRIELSPPVAGLHMYSELRHDPGPCEVSAEVLPPQPGQPASRLVIRGRWNAACGVRDLHLTPWHHEEYTLRAVGALWREAGGRLRGRVVPSLTRGTPAWPVAWPLGPDGQVQQPFSVHRSEPLPRLVREINKTSDNPAARNLMLSLAPGFPVRAATLPGARERVAAWLRRQGLAFGDIQVDSGSGLSRDEQGRPRALVHLLARAWRAPYRQAFVDSLPVAGVDGTLAHRLTRGQATGRAFMKTGTLNDTRALAGYVLGRSGNTYALAAIVNHAEAQRAVPMLDAIVEWVAASG